MYFWKRMIHVVWFPNAPYANLHVNQSQIILWNTIHMINI